MMVRVAVKPGQIYRVPRKGAPARHVRIARVTRKSGPQPVAIYSEVTRNGRGKGRAVIRHHLQFDGRAWTMGPWFEEVTQ